MIKWLLFLSTLLAFAAFERFYRLSALGMYGSDVFFYLEMAKEYLSGRFEATVHFRPIAYLMYSWALKFGGVNFYSIKALNCAIDLLNIGLLTGLSYQVLKNKWVALVPPMLYVF